MSRQTKFLIILLAVVLIVPQITLAAWWNPFSWHWGWVNSVFHFQQTQQQPQKSAGVSNSTPSSEYNLPEYVFGNNPTSGAVYVKLSQHNLSFSSPWGAEKSAKCGKVTKVSGTCSYVFKNGERMAVATGAERPNDILKESHDNGMGIADLKTEQKTFQFIASKIGSDPSFCDVYKFIALATQQKADRAVTVRDKEGYSGVLSEKESLLVSNSYNVYQFENQGGEGVITFAKSSGEVGEVRFCANNGTSYVIVPGKNSSRGDIDVFLKSLAVTN